MTDSQKDNDMTANDFIKNNLESEIDNLTHNLAVAKKRVARFTEELMATESTDPCYTSNLISAAQEVSGLSHRLDQARAMLTQIRFAEEFVG
jgi:chromosome segregation ATPase